MARKRKQKKTTRTKRPKTKSPSRLAQWWQGKDDEQRSAILRHGGWALLLVILLIGGAVGLTQLEDRILVDRQPTTAGRFSVELMDVPDWMPNELVQTIGRWVMPESANFSDENLAEQIYARAKQSPWIRETHSVRKRPSGQPGRAVVQIRADFRQPIAKVLHRGWAYFVDAEGVRLPSAEVPKWVMRVREADGGSRTVCFLDHGDIPRGVPAAPVHYIAIEGAAYDPPAVGQAWAGEDVQDALRLVRMVRMRDYAREISVVDVRNFKNRISSTEPQIQLFAQRGKGPMTRIKFGRFPDPAGDYVVSPKRKLAYLDSYFQQNGGQLAGLNESMDLRYDTLHVSPN